MWRVMTAVTRLASVEQHRPWREDDGVGHENHGLLGRKPAHVAERQLEALTDEPEERHAEDLQSSVIDCGDDLHSNILLLGSSTLLFWRSFHSSAWWESAGTVSFNFFFRIPMISMPLVSIPITLKIQNRRTLSQKTTHQRLFEFHSPGHSEQTWKHHLACAFEANINNSTHFDNASLLCVSVSVRSPFVPSTSVSRSHCRRFVSMVTVTMSC